jgi:hypothetical protein
VCSSFISAPLINLRPCSAAEDPKSTLGLTIANDPPIMPTRLPEGGSSKDDRAMAKTLLLTKVGLTNEDVNHMHRYTMAHKRVVNMTKGGRM